MGQGCNLPLLLSGCKPAPRPAWPRAAGCPTMHPDDHERINPGTVPARREGTRPMPKVTFISGKDKKEVEVAEGANLREEALKAGVSVYAGMHRYLNCRGLGLCG